MNCNGLLNGKSIQPFAFARVDLAAYQSINMNSDVTPARGPLSTSSTMRHREAEAACRRRAVGKGCDCGAVYEGHLLELFLPLSQTGSFG